LSATRNSAPRRVREDEVGRTSAAALNPKTAKRTRISGLESSCCPKNGPRLSRCFAHETRAVNKIKKCATGLRLQRMWKGQPVPAKQEMSLSITYGPGDSPATQPPGCEAEGPQLETCRAAKPSSPSASPASMSVKLSVYFEWTPIASINGQHVMYTGSAAPRGRLLSGSSVQRKATTGANSVRPQPVSRYTGG